MTGRPGQTLPISKEKEKEGYLSTPEEKKDRERRGGKYAKKEKEKKNVKYVKGGSWRKPSCK